MKRPFISKLAGQSSNKLSHFPPLAIVFRPLKTSNPFDQTFAIVFSYQILFPLTKKKKKRNFYSLGHVRKFSKGQKIKSKSFTKRPLRAASYLENDMISQLVRMVSQ